ncbi:MAG: glycosyltransferase family 39 protein [Bryobacterales bacterium]|nr:glycosyltransferase family 39 protein [Acidobacteriota bacterium]MCB9385379.1 glycosyltransferase family 39 protein [Bryobacterales bacterium]
MILLVVAFATLAAACRRGAGVRDAVMSAAVIFGAIAVFTTENLSLLGALRRDPVAIVWALVIVGASTISWRRTARWGVSQWPPWREVWPEALSIGAVAVLSGLVGVTALISAPNSADAMAYHLPRIVYWIQQASVSLFPTHYLNQVMLQPFAEYITLQTWLLSDGDRFANLPQYCAYLLCISGASLVAKEMGGIRRAQVIAAVACATLPNAVLQASGAKNDLVLAFTLSAFVYFGIRYGRRRGRDDLAYASLAAALALFTKGTAYLFLPPLFVAIVTVAERPPLVGRNLGLACAVATLLTNGPLYLRNVRLSGSPLGFDSAHADGKFRWRNEPPGFRATASNLLRHTADQLGARSPSWNRGLYDVVERAHVWIGADLNAPGTTWRWSKFETPRNDNHEASANNRVHLMLYALCCVAAMLSPAARKALWLPAALLAGMVLFAGYLKWQPFQIRMLAPLYVLGAPLAGFVLARGRTLAQFAFCALLLDGARLPATENWTRPLEGPRSIFRIERSAGYFADLAPWGNEEAYRQAADWILESGCSSVGLDLSEYQIEYPLIALLRARNPAVRFRHINVRNPSRAFDRDEARPVWFLVFF